MALGSGSIYPMAVMASADPPFGSVQPAGSPRQAAGAAMRAAPSGLGKVSAALPFLASAAAVALATIAGLAPPGVNPLRTSAIHRLDLANRILFYTRAMGVLAWPERGLWICTSCSP